MAIWGFLLVANQGAQRKPVAPIHRPHYFSTIVLLINLFYSLFFSFASAINPPDGYLDGDVVIGGGDGNGDGKSSGSCVDWALKKI